MEFELVERALEFAAAAHGGQVTESDPPLPYIFHPMEVALILTDVGKVRDLELQAAALLHDTLEHSATSEETLLNEFGERITSLVKELTRTEPSPEETTDLSKDEIWSLRSRLLLQGVSAMSDEALLIKLADRIANFRLALASKKGKKLKRYREQTREILKISSRLAPHPLHVALGRLVDES